MNTAFSCPSTFCHTLVKLICYGNATYREKLCNGVTASKNVVTSLENYHHALIWIRHRNQFIRR